MQSDAAPAAITPFRVAALAVTTVVVAVRFVHLDGKPAEWYGDISTLYEYVVALRNDDRPPGWYVLGVGPLYPMLLRPFLWVLGDSYLAIKLAAVTYSLAGLLLLFRFGRQLVDRNLALVAAAVGGLMSWWLVYSRLGDLQAITPTLTIATLSATMWAVREQRPWPAGVAAGLAMLGIYTYGNLFVLPVLVAVALAAAWRERRIGASHLAAAGGTAAVVALPMLYEFAVNPDAVLHGHVGGRFVGWGDLPTSLLRGYAEALRAYVGEGDSGFRGNVVFASHIDKVMLVFAVAGIVWWLRGPRVRQGLFLVGSFLLLHLPSVLAGVEEVPSVSRTTAAAPLVALFAAAGICASARAVGQWWRPTAGPVFMTAVVVAIGALGVHQYFERYIPGLPYGNTSISAAMTEYVDNLPPNVTVYLVGTGWRDQMPALKSVRYAAANGERVLEEPPTLDCVRLAELSRPAVLLFDFESELPSESLRACADALEQRVLHYTDGKPVFASVALDSE